MSDSKKSAEFTVFDLFNSAYYVKKSDNDRERAEFNQRCESIAKSLRTMDNGSLETIKKSAKVATDDELVVSLAKSSYAKEGRKLPETIDFMNPIESFRKSAAELRERNPYAYNALLHCIKKAADKRRDEIVYG